MPAVFDLNNYIHAFAEGFTYENVVMSMGDGYEIRGTKNQAFTGADGIGGVTSHKGLRRFRLTVGVMHYANGLTTAPTNKLIALLRTVDGNVTAFYFYSPKEAPAPDLTGTSTTGRYLVRFMEPAQDIEFQAVTFYQATFTLIEVRA